MKRKPTTSQDTKAQARELLLKARVYRFFAVCFALTGLVIFLVLYSSYFSGNIMEALESPATILIILVQFLPAIVLSWLSCRLENKLYRLVEKEGAGGE